MSESIANSKTEELKLQQEQLRTYLNEIANRIAAYTSGREFAPYRMQIKALDEDGNLVLISDEEVANPKECDSFQEAREWSFLLTTALGNPNIVEGALIIISGGETILHIERGKVLQDTIGLTLKYPLENQLYKQKHTIVLGEDFDKVFREIAGKSLVKYGYGILAFFGTRSEDGSVSYETDNYIYTEIEKQLKIIAKKDNKEVLNNNGFTQAATKEDIIVFVKLKEGIEKLKLDNPPPLIPNIKL